MPTTFQGEHECNAYCREHRHADVFWTPATDQTLRESADAMLRHHGLRLVHWQPAPEAPFPAGEEAIQWSGDRPDPRFAPFRPQERPVLLVWEDAD